MKKNYWENIYRSNKHRSMWPWHDVVKLTKKYYTKKRKNSILELGCGYGANIPFFLSEKFNYNGIDFSEFAINHIKRKFPSIRDKLYKSDLNRFNYDNLKNKFDLILDRGTLTHLKDDDIIKLFQKLLKITNKNSIVICCSLYSDKCQILKENKNKNFFSSGIFKNVGYINFFNKKKIYKTFSNWEILFMEEVMHYNYLKKKEQYSYWNIVLKKI